MILKVLLPLILAATPAYAQKVSAQSDPAAQTQGLASSATELFQMWVNEKVSVAAAEARIKDLEAQNKTLADAAAKKADATDPAK